MSDNRGAYGESIGRSGWLVIVAATVLGLGSRAFVLTRPGFLTSGGVEFDDGVYLGAAIRVLQGALPYRDFAFVQPPGILILSLPAAAPYDMGAGERRRAELPQRVREAGTDHRMTRR